MNLDGAVIEGRFNIVLYSTHKFNFLFPDGALGKLASFLHFCVAVGKTPCGEYTLFKKVNSERRCTKE